ncbi:MAG: hypothetical protein C4524_02955 [Candidatus Zixiibacteriota bacterium]|nr:MAG: hypothetical protein C4524_02955 [candidate division Zixibacteria bacterium]
MKKDKTPSSNDDMLPEYDFRGGERGKYAQRYAAGSNVVVIDPEVAEFFPDSESVNKALKALADILRERMKPEKAEDQ